MVSKGKGVVLCSNFCSTLPINLAGERGNGNMFFSKWRPEHKINKHKNRKIKMSTNQVASSVWLAGKWKAI
jgi:hypothetical protein